MDINGHLSELKADAWAHIEFFGAGKHEPEVWIAQLAVAIGNAAEATLEDWGDPTVRLAYERGLRDTAITAVRACLGFLESGSGGAAWCVNEWDACDHSEYYDALVRLIGSAVLGLQALESEGADDEKS